MSAPSGSAPTGTGLRWTASARTELADLSVLLTAIEAHDHPIERHSLTELEESYDEEGADPGRDLIVGRDDDGTVVAYGWVHPVAGDVDPRRAFLFGGVHPDRRREGIGSAVLAWQLARARQWYAETRRPEHGPLQASTYADAKATDQLSLYERFGFAPLRWFADMSLRFDALTEGVPQPRVPAGFVLRPFTAALSEPVRAAHNAAFADHWGSQPVTELRWNQQLASATFRPGWSWAMVQASDGFAPPRVVGYAMNSAYEQDWDEGVREGWTDRLGVCRAFRGRGIAQALLIASMRSFAAAGLDGAGLGVDTENPSGAFGLYRKLGYRAGGTAVTHGLTAVASTACPDTPSGPPPSTRRPSSTPGGPSHSPS